MLVNVIIQHPDDLITFGLEIGFPPAIMGDFAILRMGCTVYLNDEPRVPTQEVHNIGANRRLPNELEVLFHLRPRRLLYSRASAGISAPRREKFSAVDLPT